MSIKIKREWIISLLPILFLLANVYRLSSGKLLLYLVSMVVAGATGILYTVKDFKNNKSATKCFIYIALSFVICACLNFVFIGNADAGLIVQEIFYFGMTYLLVNYAPTKAQASVLFYVTSGMFIIMRLLGYRPSQTLSSSGNYISVLVIIAAAVYYTSAERNGERIALLPAIITFALAIWANGRGGILTSAILLVGIVIIIINNVDKEVWRNRKLLSIFIVVFIILLVVFGLCNDELNQRILHMFRSFVKEGMDNSARIAIWSDYISSSLKSITGIVLGTPEDNVRLLKKFAYNPHNSFIYLHITHGILPLLVLIVLSIKSVAYYMKNKQWAHFLLMLVLFARAFLDKFAISQYGMPVLMYFLILPVFQEHNQNDETEL